jgi:C-7 ketoreductase
VTATPVLRHAGFTDEQIAESAKGLQDRIPLGRIARPEAGYLNGTVVRVDGGLSAAV